MAFLRFLDGLDLEMETDEGENETLEVLDEIVETAETVRVAGLVDIHEGPNLAGGEADVLVTDNDFQLLAIYDLLVKCYKNVRICFVDAYLTTNAVRLGPEGVVLSHDLAILDDSAELVHDGTVDIGLLADHRVVLVVAVVGVPNKTGNRST